MKTDRFKLEELIVSLGQINEDLSTMLEKEFDTKEGLTEDQKMNIIIGMRELHKIRYDATWESMNRLIEQGDLK
jgi:hypothetical protein